MATITIQEFIDRLAPCEEARLWLATQPNIDTAWRTCTRPDWMLWALSNLRPMSELEAVNLCCRFVRETPLADGRGVADLLTDPRSVAFLELKESWVAGGGGPKPEGWNAALDAAEDAAWEAALDAAGATARAAAEAAAGAAAGATAGATEGDAAWDAAWAAARAAARGATAEDAAEEVAVWDAAWAAQAAIIRSAIPTLA